MTTTELTMPAAAVAELEATLDTRTREILERRRASKVVHRRGWLVRRALAGADMLGLTIAFFLAVWLFGGDAPGPVADRLSRQLEVLLFLLTLPGWVVMAKLYGLYDRDEERTDHSTADDFGGVFHMITVGAWGTFLIAWGTDIVAPQIDKVIGFWALAILLVCVLRATARAYCRRQVEYLQNTIIVGAGDVGQLIAKKYLNHPEYGINLAGFVDSEPKERREDLGHLTLLGGPERIKELIELLDVERVVIAFSNESHEEELDVIRRLKEYDVQVDIVPRLYEVVGPGVGMHTVEGMPLLGLAPPRLSRSSALLKRAFDICVAGVGLVLLAPLFCLVAFAIKLDSRGAVFFRQERAGCGGRTFRIYKFRSMTTDAEMLKQSLSHLNVHAKPGGDVRMFKIADDPRVTRVGRVLRRFCVDELPQLLNVLVGHMSLVGPRPLILSEDHEVREWGRRRLDLKPGITGLWQVLGSSGISFEEMVKLDYIYVTSWSLFGDVKLLARTLPVVARTRTAY